MRHAVLVDTMVAAIGVGAVAQGATTKTLPLDNLGLEHLDIVVPDPAASARFYRASSGPHSISSRCATRCATSSCSATFPPNGRSATSPLARPQAERRRSATTACWRRSTTARAWRAHCRPPASASPRRGRPGMWPDPDGLELQLFQPPAGLVTAAVPSTLPTPRDGLLIPRGVDHLLLRVRSLEKSLPYYRLVYGPAAERPRDANGRVTFELAHDTRLVLEETPPGQAPAIAHYALKVAPFDRAALIARLRDLGARVLEAADEPDVVRFADNNGIVVEVRVAK